MGDCYWDCGRPFCQPGQQLDNDCVAANADGSCPDGFSRGQQGAGVCCPQVAEGGGGCDPSLFQECLNVEGARWDESSCRCIGYPSPVLVDTTGDGFRLTSAEGGVLFDLDGEGKAERLSWTAEGSDDSWLTMDRDSDGRVGSGRELFGDFTPQPPSPAPNGFLALAEYDRPHNGGNGDGVIDARDSIFASLRLWRDSNHDGVSQAAELHTLTSLDVARLHLAYKESKRTDEFGNRFRYRAKVDDAKGAKAGRWAWDVFLVTAP